jgi:hypothetical protein
VANRTAEFNMAARTSARKSMGTVDRNQIANVFVSDCQKRSSLTRNRKFCSPT